MIWRDGIDGAERVRDVADRHHAGPRAEQLFVLLENQLAASLMGITRSLAPFSSQSICQGTMFE